MPHNVDSLYTFLPHFFRFFLHFFVCFFFSMADGNSSPPPPPLDLLSGPGSAAPDRNNLPPPPPPPPQGEHLQRGQQQAQALNSDQHTSSGIHLNPNRFPQVDLSLLQALQNASFPYQGASSSSQGPSQSRDLPPFSGVFSGLSSVPPRESVPTVSNQALCSAIGELASVVKTSSADMNQRLESLERSGLGSARKSAFDPESFKNKHSKNEVANLNSIRDLAAQHTPGEISTALFDKICALVDSRVEVLKVGETYGWDVADQCICAMCLFFVTSVLFLLCRFSCFSMCQSLRVNHGVFYVFKVAV